MDKIAIKNYSIWARRTLIEGVKQKAFEYSIEKDKEIEIGLSSISGRILSNEEKNQRDNLIKEIKNKSFDQVIEEVSYTWFNRFIALRYMEVNGYLPSKVRVFSNEEGEFNPEIIKEALNLNFENIDKEIIYKYIENNDNENLFKYLLIAQCNELGRTLPFMFEKISDYTELLFPNNLLREDSVIGRLVKDIDEDDWKDNVEILGFIHESYILELKDNTFALLNKNVKISKERIPIATRLFTPEWIAKYMVQNSLGRLWYEGHRDFDKSNWKYYMDEAEQEYEVEEKLKEIRKEYSTIKPEDIKLIDPSMGSGHILANAFEVLMEIYVSQGWRERDAAISILENNIYGLDIDKRSVQMAYFMLMMKARKYNLSILDNKVETNIISIIDSSFMNEEFIEYFSNGILEIEEELNKLKDTFKNAKILGSIINVSDINYPLIESILNNSSNYNPLNVDWKNFNIFLKQIKILSDKYDVVLSSPPHMGGRGMNPILKKYIQKNYPYSKSDLFAVFVERWNKALKVNRFNTMFTKENWMFLSSFEKFRKIILEEHEIINLLYMDNKVMGTASGTSVTNLFSSNIVNYKVNYNEIKFTDIIDNVPISFPIKENRNNATNTNNYKLIQGSPIAYWVSNRVFNLFKNNKNIEEYLEVKSGISIGDNDRFLRLWWEINFRNVNFKAKDRKNFLEKNKKWVPYNKGGGKRQWYGNYDYLINWEKDGSEIKRFKSKNGKKKISTANSEYYFKEAITWGNITTGKFNIRYREPGSIFDCVGPSAFSSHNILYYIMGVLSTNISNKILDILNPTVHVNVGNVKNFPLIINKEKEKDVLKLVDINIELAKEDWNSYEDSWNFKRHPLI